VFQFLHLSSEKRKSDPFYLYSRYAESNRRNPQTFKENKGKRLAPMLAGFNRVREGTGGFAKCQITVMEKFVRVMEEHMAMIRETENSSVN